ncbi:putative Interferon-induced GTP-binding protein Mx [Glarea lozoyensis 74030]|uniref:Putative Interferon-induced GTP-binding protein Mx n=1 Tax=Glarea lozoyensis (strain ATCC 74030 / MF5533) TaxID=1104152 RepID=H0EKX2_GLAL7|nr:putative Interferon-induced GTP-binding protein Mx [Glarea lozoyensis 74030]
MVAREMRKPNSTILAVVAANVDVQTQTIFGLCAETDRSGDRTIGIVTQPDVSPERAPMYVDLAIGKTSIGKYKYPWHVLKNRSAKELEARTDMRSRNDEEKRYLDEHPWNQIPQENRGIEALRKRLSERLFGEAIKVFPELATQATTKLSGFQRDLKALGGENRTTAEMESIFRTATKSLSKLTEAYSKGRYEYKTIDFESSHAIYLRARIVDQSELFYHRIMTEGHTWSSHIDISAIDPDSDFELSQSNSLKATMNKRKPEVMTREAEIELAKKHLREKRGNEFPLTWDPHHINEFFWKLSREWDGIASEHIAKVHTHCESYFHHATHLSFRPSASKDPKPTFTNHADVATRYFTLSKTHLKHRQDDAERELEKIESDRQGLQTNFNRAYKVQYRQQKNERNMQKAVGAFVRNMDPAETNPNTFAEHQGRQTLEDQVTEVAEDFLRAAWIHYKVIERHFLQDISDVPPEREAMDERAFKALVEEDRGLEMQKAELKDKIDTLEECLEILEPYR